MDSIYVEITKDYIVAKVNTNGGVYTFPPKDMVAETLLALGTGSASIRKDLAIVHGIILNARQDNSVVAMKLALIRE